MKKYYVEVPIAGYIRKEVVANDPKEAMEIAISTEWSEEDVQEINAYRKLVEGNICWVSPYKASILDEEDIEE